MRLYLIVFGLVAISSQAAVNSPFQESFKTITVKNMMTKLSLLKQNLSATPALLGSISLFVALIPISLAPSLAKLSEQEIGANAVGFHRSWIATVVFGLWKGLEALRRQQSDHQLIEQKPLTKKDVWLLLAMGTASTISLLLWAWSLSQTSVANVALLSNLNPLFVAAAGYLLFGRRFDNRFIIGMVMALLGAIAFEVHKMQFATSQILGDALALVTAIFIATYLLLIEQLQTRFTTATIMLWRCGVTTIFLLPVLPFIEERLFPYSGMGWFLIIFQALFCQVLGQGLVTYSLSRLSSGVVAVTLLFNPVLASIFAWFIFSEQVSLFDWVTFAVILVGIYLAQSSQSTVQVTEEGS